MEQALSDVTVLDLGQVIAMPFCTMLLADMGARVIKVESLEQARERLSLGMKRVRNGVEERVPVYQYRDRNKQAITLNLKTSQGVELFNEETSDGQDDLRVVTRGGQTPAQSGSAATRFSSPS